MTEREVLKLALEALEVANSCIDGYYIPKGKTHLPEIELAITAIKEALAQPEHGWTPERIAGMARLKDAQDKRLAQPEPENITASSVMFDWEKKHGPRVWEAYARKAGWTPQRKPLTDEEIDRICGDVGYGYIAVARAIEALAQPEQEQLMSDQINYGMSVTQGGKRIDPMSIYKEPEQKPVALETVYETIIQWDEGGGKRSRRELAKRIVSLYTTTPQRKPWVGLMEEEVDECYYWKDRLWTTDELVRHVEAKLREKNA